MIFNFLHRKGNNSHAKHGTSAFRKFGRDPYFDWMFILIVFILISLGLIYYGYARYELVNDSDGDTNIGKGTEKGQSFDVGLMNNVINTIDTQADERKMIMGGYSGPDDPSK